MEARSSRRWRLAGGYALALASALWAAFYAVMDRDLPLHLALGRWMSEHTWFPARDPFTYTTADVPFTNHEWAFDLAAYGIFDALGVPGILAARLALVAALVLLVLALARRLGAPKDGWAALAAAILLLVLLPLARPRLIERPHLVGVVLLFAHLLAARRLADAPAGRERIGPALALTASLPLWAALHGSWPLAFVVTGAHAVASGGARRAFVAVGLAQLALLPLGPYGFEVALVPFTHLADPAVRRYFTEFQPATAHLSQGLLASAAALVAAFGAAVLARRRRRDLAEVLVACAFAVLAFRSYRFVTPWLLLLVPPTAARLGLWLGEAGRARAIPAAAALLLAAGGTYGLLFDDQPQPLEPAVTWDTRYQPRAAAETIRAHALPGPVFNDLDVGGDLMWTLGPAWPLAIDGRFYLYAGGFFDAYLRALDDPAAFDAHVARHGVQLALLSWTLPRHRTLAAHLSAAPGWALVHLDGTYAVWARDEALRRAASDGLVLSRVQPGGTPDDILRGPPDAALAAEIARVDAASHAPFGDYLRVGLLWREHRATGDLAPLRALVPLADRVLEAQPRFLYALKRRGQARLRLGDREGAARDLGIVARVTGDPEARQELEAAGAGGDAPP